MICCATCQRPFNKPGSLQQHMITFQDAPTHTGLPVLWLPTLAALAETRDSSSTDSEAEPLLTPSSSTASHNPLKPFHCHICSQSFGTQQAMAAHLRDAPDHPPSFPCQICNRKFRTKEAVNEHQRATGHDADAVRFVCKICSRQFKTSESLNMHTRALPSHATSFKCQPCNRTFSSQAALEEHTRAAKAHISISCQSCTRTFKTQAALDNHTRASHPPAHLKCPLCSRKFKDIDALRQHLRDAPIHQAEASTSPLDTFFTSFPGFHYDPEISPSKSFEALVNYNEWEEGSPDGEDAWVLWQEAMGEEIRLWAETEDELARWLSICCVIGVKPLPATCEEAKRAIMKKLTTIVEMAVGFAKLRKR